MSLPRYPEYKDSGVEWLGEVPGHWEVVPFYSVAKEREESNIGMVEDNLLSLSYGRIVQKDITSNDGLLPESFETYQIVRRGDMVFRLTDLQNDKRSLRTAIVEETGIITSAYVAAKPIRIEPLYLSQLLRSYDSQKVFYSMGGGLRQSMKFSDLKRLPTLLPSPEEQQTIAAFLDRETGKIDALIAEQRRLVELLAEKRQAVISHAVTKGISQLRHSGHDPESSNQTIPRSGQSGCPAAQESSNQLDSGLRRNDGVVMKDSGIEWLGEVPEHWNVVPLGHLATQIQTGPFGSQLHAEDYVEGETPVINPSNIQDGKLVADWSCTVTQEIVARLSQHKLMIGDIVFARRGEMGRCAMVTSNEVDWLCGTGSLNVRLSDRAIPVFISIYLRTAYVRELLKLESVGSTMDNLNTQILSGVSVPLPPIAEQQTIAAFLDTETAKFDTLTAEANRAIALLQERRSALISAAVTGKIDVRSNAAC